MKNNTVTILIWCLVGIFFLTYITENWITSYDSSHEIISIIFAIFEIVNSLLRWPSLLAAMGLAFWQRQQAIDNGTEPRKTWIWVTLIVVAIFLSSALIFLAVMMGAAYI